ncbi:uncharacterized protein T551_01427 [Pneumocystis jirovecii RU7]|uniref:Uncharacterized protein n=1 Tax=Pneumocystis jirovecii (strain RU7) TaxID=1408657 RepID=A0A0W4ZSI7_PNEJ7|nr:uncharacterized protein T551_01427 [Pneumocystis jirovecii RU7]KTW31355.1 hypothetical protein T551_01427 [Pneumocystis jirovecii RU7]
MEKIQVLVSTENLKEGVKRRATIHALSSYLRNFFDIEGCMRISTAYCSILMRKLCLEYLEEFNEMGKIYGGILEATSIKVKKECKELNVTIPSKDIPLQELSDEHSDDISFINSEKKIYTGTGTVITHLVVTVTNQQSHLIQINDPDEPDKSLKPEESDGLEKSNESDESLKLVELSESEELS